MKKIYYNKLIRDRIPQVIQEKGSECKVRKLQAKEFDQELIRKVGEEASGLLGATDKKEFIAELADIVDVIEEIKKRKKISSHDIKVAQKEALKRKGAFEKRFFLEWSSDDSYKTNERKYDQK